MASLAQGISVLIRVVLAPAGGTFQGATAVREIACEAFLRWIQVLRSLEAHQRAIRLFGVWQARDCLFRVRHWAGIRLTHPTAARLFYPTTGELWTAGFEELEVVLPPIPEIIEERGL